VVQFADAEVVGETGHPGESRVASLFHLQVIGQGIVRLGRILVAPVPPDRIVESGELPVLDPHAGEIVDPGRQPAVVV